MSDTTAQHRQAYAYCTYCPKMCRFACPVSEATHSETTSTWGKMTEANLVTLGQRPLEEGGAKALYACTGCMKCRTYCKHENEVGFALFSARQLAVDTEKAPKGALSTLKTFAQHGNPFGAELASAVARHKVEGPARYALFPGCTSLVKRPEVIEDALAIGRALSTPFTLGSAAGRCCGYPLYAAGDERGFQRHAESMAQALGQYRELVVIDPGCAYTLKVVYPRVGVELPLEIRTIYEVLADALSHAPERERLPLKAAYHDACHLGRGLGQYEEPRRLLAAACSEVLEGAENRDGAGCSGGGGLLPRTMTETSVEIARTQAEKLAPGDETVVTACPTSRRMFERSGRKAADLLSVVREWLRA